MKGRGSKGEREHEGGRDRGRVRGKSVNEK